MKDDVILTHKARVDGVVIDWPHGPLGAQPGDPSSRPPEGFMADVRAATSQQQRVEQANARLAAVMQVQWLRDRLAVATVDADQKPPIDLNPLGRARRRAEHQVKVARAQSVVADLNEDLAVALEAARKLAVPDDELSRRAPQVWEGSGKRYVYVALHAEPVPFGSPAAAFSFPSEDDSKLAKLRGRGQ